jgi:hypothetical protein
MLTTSSESVLNPISLEVNLRWHNIYLICEILSEHWVGGTVWNLRLHFLGPANEIAFDAWDLYDEKLIEIFGKNGHLFTQW